METNTIETVGVIIFSEDKENVLLVVNLPRSEHLPKTYVIPAGRVQDDQTLEANAVRELEEETGLLTNEANLIPLPFEYEADIPRKDGTVKHFHMKTFLCKAYSGNLIEGVENRPVWIKVEDMEQLNLLPNMMKVIHDALWYK